MGDVVIAQNDLAALWEAVRQQTVALREIEEALFGDCQDRDADALVLQAEHLSRLAQFEQAVWTIAWHTGRSVTLVIGGGHEVVHRLSVGGWSKEDSPIAFYNSGDLGRLEERVIAYADRLAARKANMPLPDPEDDQ